MKRALATLISCVALLSATVSVPALAEAKDEAEQFNVSVVQNAFTVASDGIQSILDGVKTNIAELFGVSEPLASEGEEHADTSASTSSQDIDSASYVPSNIDGVVWDAGYTTCRLLSGHNFIGSSLSREIGLHRGTLTTFEAEDNTGLTGDGSYLFVSCQNLRTVNFAESFDTSQVTDMSSMFSNCQSLTSLALPDAFDTSLVTDMSSMFSSCFDLEILTLPDAFNTRSVRSMNYMFDDCTQLESLDLSMFSSESLTTCTGMFVNCDNLRELNLGNFVPPAGQESLAMFADMNFATFDISGGIPNIEKITMSGACILEPGEGTVFDAATGTFFDYKEPLSWKAYYQGTAAEEQPSAQDAQNNLSDEPAAVLTGFDEFKAYQETHPELTTYVLFEQPTPPGPTPEPTPDPTPDVVPASDTDVLPLTGDTSAGLSLMVFTVLSGALILVVWGYCLSRKRSL